jgi:hypothetical protein
VIHNGDDSHTLQKYHQSDIKTVYRGILQIIQIIRSTHVPA